MAKAFKYAMKGCELDHISSCVNVSQMYRRGDGVKKNEELADKYKERAKKLHKEAKENVVQIEFQNTKWEFQVQYEIWKEERITLYFLS